MSSRKDDPVFNVKFVQLVESKPCLWNSTLPEYSKKDEIQKAWQEVANETKDTVRNCRERWRTIRSSFLRSLKLSRTSTGRGKRKYYLSKYLQFLIPFTKTRLKNSSTIIAQRKAAAAGNIPPMTRINNMPIVSSDDTKDSSNSAEVAGIAEGDVMVTLHEGAIVGGGVNMTTQHGALPLPQPLNLQAIKEEKDLTSSSVMSSMMAPMDRLMQSLDQQLHLLSNSSVAVGNSNNNTSCSNNNNKNITNPTTNNNNNLNTTNNSIQAMNATSSQKIANNNNNSNSTNNNNNNTHPPQQTGAFPHTTETRSSASAVDLSEFAEWIKSKNEHQRHCLMTTSPDADQSFLNSLHPYLKEMSGKQSRRFRQKVVALIDDVLDNKD